ncbi:MAG: hypothetical protein JO265_05515 [Acidimicrobiia bacterium]|nr:hypothetical protein [Acidimicrobiia bacterium]
MDAGGHARPGPRALVLAATDPANPYGGVLPWPVSGGRRAKPDGRRSELSAAEGGTVDGRRPGKGPQRAAGAYVVLLDGVASLYLERGGRAVVALRDYDGSWEAPAVDALAGLVAEGRLRRLALERFDDVLAPVLRAAGFVPSPRGLVRYG